MGCMCCSSSIDSRATQTLTVTTAVVHLYPCGWVAQTEDTESDFCLAGFSNMFHCSVHIKNNCAGHSTD